MKNDRLGLKFDLSIGEVGSVARSPKINKILDERNTKIKYFGRLKTRSICQSLLELTMVKVNMSTINKSIGNETTKNCDKWPSCEAVRKDNSVSKNSQSCLEMPWPLKALGVDGRDFYVKRLTFSKSSWKTASHKYQPAISMDFYRKTGTPNLQAIKACKKALLARFFQAGLQLDTNLVAR